MKFSNRLFISLLSALLVVRLILMAAIPVFDPSEARYAALSANMARSGDFVIPHFTHEGLYQSFDGKPPLVFQAGGIFCECFGVCEFAVRLFPLLSAALLLWILFCNVRRASGSDDARLAVLITATSAAFFADAGIAMTDMSLACCVAGALLCYRSFLADERWRDAVGVVLAMAVGMLVKGPVALAMFGLPVLVDAAVNRHWRKLFNWKWLALSPLFFAVAAPWFFLVEQRNPGSVWYFFYNENFLRFVSHDYGDRYGAGREAFRGAAILWAFISVLPWSLLPCWWIFRHAAGWREALRRAARKCWQCRDFAFISAVVITLFWCLTSRVLIYYLFPVIPLFAAVLVEKSDRRPQLAKIVPAFAAFSALAVSVALIAGACASDKMQGAKTPDYCGYLNRYSHEFYHGTNPRCREAKVSFEDVCRTLWAAEAKEKSK